MGSRGHQHIATATRRGDMRQLGSCLAPERETHNKEHMNKNYTIARYHIQISKIHLLHNTRSTHDTIDLQQKSKTPIIP